MPEKNPSGTESTKAQGQEITRNINALLNHILKFPSVIKGGMIASKTAAQTTKGVYTLANFVINCSVFDFFAVAFSTISNIFTTVELPKFLVTCILNNPLIFKLPLYTASPTDTFTGNASPVNAEVSSCPLPCTTMPSKGIFSPAFTTI